MTTEDASSEFFRLPPAPPAGSPQEPLPAGVAPGGATVGFRKRLGVLALLYLLPIIVLLVFGGSGSGEEGFSAFEWLLTPIAVTGLVPIIGCKTIIAHLVTSLPYSFDDYLFIGFVAFYILYNLLALTRARAWTFWTLAALQIPLMVTGLCILLPVSWDKGP